LKLKAKERPPSDKLDYLALWRTPSANFPEILWLSVKNLHHSQVPLRYISYTIQIKKNSFKDRLLRRLQNHSVLLLISQISNIPEMIFKKL